MQNLVRMVSVSIGADQTLVYMVSMCSGENQTMVCMVSMCSGKNQTLVCMVNMFGWGNQTLSMCLEELCDCVVPPEWKGSSEESRFANTDLCSQL